MDFPQSVRSLNRIKLRSQFLAGLIKIVRAVLFGLVAISVWAIVRPEDQLAQLSLGLVTMLAALLLSNRRSRKTIAEDDVLLAIEIENQNTKTPASHLRNAADVTGEWLEILQQKIKAQRKYEGHRLLILFSTLLIPAVVSTITLPKAAPSIKTALAEVSDVVATFSRGASLKIIKGATSEEHKEEIPLEAGKKVEIELLAQNMVEVTVKGGGFKDTLPTVELFHTPEDFSDIEPEPSEPEEDTAASTDEVADEEMATDKTSSAEDAEPEVAATPPRSERVKFQSFQLAPVTMPASSKESTKTFSISFAVTEPVELSIPVIDDEPLAKIRVKQLPVPKVRLTPLSRLEDPWPDDRPLALKIEVKAENPLQLVRLLIKSGGRTSNELVANVMAEDKKALSTTYNLILESYVESDLAQVEIVAEAIDRAVPTPLAGYSKPLRINTASAYGRYRQALRTLRELKTQLDEAVEEQKNLPEEAGELAAKASEQSEESPFFDGRDRVQIHKFDSQMQALRISKSQEDMMELSEELNDFLFEHELLDNRERDRDFFVAARSLSRLIEQDRDERPVEVETVTERMRSFLDDRHRMWEARVGRIPADKMPGEWEEVRQQPFHAAMNQIAAAEKKAERQAREEQLTTLSRAVEQYREWIEALETAEDVQRQQQDRERQEGLANARNTMRELQKRQGEVSKQLDRAATKSPSKMESQWPSTRMKQNTNLSETRRLEGQLRSLSPTAGVRIKAAVEAMRETLGQGNEGEFVQAESNSDLAGRLLRQADAAAQRSQQRRQDRGRRRRVTGDNYYGQSVVGGDIEIRRDYQVDKRYREDVLDEVQGAGYDEESRALMENYLRQIIR